MSNGTTNGNGDPMSVSYWLRYLASQGPITVFLAAMFYFVAAFVFPSMRADQTRYIDATIANNNQLTRLFTELQQTHATGFADMKQQNIEANKRLDGILQAQNEQTPILRQIRDESKAWNQPKATQ